MSVEALAEALQQKDVPPTQRLVLIYLADRMNYQPGSICQAAWPSIDRLSEDTGLSRRTVQRSLRLLEERGLISVGPRDGGRVEYLWCISKRPGDGGDWIPGKESEMAKDWLKKRRKGGVRSGQKGASEVAGGVTVTPQGCHSDAHYKNHKHNHKENMAPEAPSGVWDVARGWLGRPLLNKILSENNEEVVKSAIFKTLDKRPADPKTYLLGALKDEPKGSSGSKPVWQMTDEEIMALCKERGISTYGKSRREIINALR